MNNESDLEYVADKIYQMTGEIIAEGQKPFAVAAVLTMVALQIYKTSLSENDYNKMVDSISESRDKVKSLTEMIKSDFLRSFH